MSKDLGIFILETKGPEYRVALAEADPNLYGHWNMLTEEWDYDAQTIREAFCDSDVFLDRRLANGAANGLSFKAEVDNIYLEYGISWLDKWKDLRYYEL